MPDDRENTYDYRDIDESLRDEVDRRIQSALSREKADQKDRRYRLDREKLNRFKRDNVFRDGIITEAYTWF